MLLTIININVSINIIDTSKKNPLDLLIAEFQQVQQDFLTAPRIRPAVPYYRPAQRLEDIVKANY